MLSLFLFAATANAVVRAKIRFDMEAGNFDFGIGPDDETHENTNCKVCAGEVKGGKTRVHCKQGLRNQQTDVYKACINMDRDFSFQNDIIIQTDCGDALWFDRLIACEQDGSIRWPHELAYDCWGAPEKAWGGNNNHGWCLSTDRNDWKGWGPQKITSNTCFRAMTFKNNGVIWGHYRNKITPNRRLDEDVEDPDDSGMQWTFDESDSVKLVDNPIHKTVVIEEYMAPGPDRRLSATLKTLLDMIDLEQ